MTPASETPKAGTCDVLVIGGGPAGSTVSAFLAEQGHQVVLLEKAHHPRFHIGESLLPANLPLFERMGISEEVKAIGMYKPGAEFVSPHHDWTQRIEFAEGWDKSMPHAYQVPRAEFDHILIKTASKKGAMVHGGHKVIAVAFQDEGAGATVTAKVLNQYRGPKEIAFKFKRRKGFHKTKGYRRSLTKLEVTSIAG